MMDNNFATDISHVQQIAIIPTLLDVICQTTGMGFAAVARVTSDRWIACAVKDDISFGLKPGGELKLETTICNEIKDSGKGVIIDHVSQDANFCNHHTPAMYGFESYISLPVFLKSGEFFGTLCAIDPKPAQLNNPKIIGMFTLFAELIAFHLQAVAQMETAEKKIQRTGRQLEHFKEETSQFQHISNHTLKEPLRKLSLFSEQLLNQAFLPGQENMQKMAAKINALSNDFLLMVQGLSDYSALEDNGVAFEIVDLNEVLLNVLSKLRLQVLANNVEIRNDVLHVVSGIPGQISLLFYHLISNAIKFLKPGAAGVITVSSKDISPAALQKKYGLQGDYNYCEVFFEDNGIGINKNELEKIFTLFTKLNIVDNGMGIGLAQCRKIIRNHHGEITVSSVEGEGSVFSIALPVDKVLV